jgi:DNA-directed RNA polymerase II subunit RPB3
MAQKTYFTIRPNETDDYLEFELQNTSISMANAIRRIALSELEIYAIKETDIKLKENTTPLHNEYISHRISILPINQRLDGLENFVFYISKKHTKDIAIENNQNGIMDITTDDLQVFDTSSDSWVNSKDIFTETFLITKLNVKQKLLGEFVASKGTAQEHARWQGVSTISYRYKVKKDLENVEYDKITLEDEREWIKKDNNDPSGFIFYLETSGVMEPRLVIKNCLEIIKNKLDKFKAYIKTNSAKLGWTSGHMLDFEYDGEMHTLGNLIATMGLEVLGENDFIGYRIIHPMMNKFIMRMKLADSDNKDTHIDRLFTVCEGIQKHVDDLMESLKKM